MVKKQTYEVGSFWYRECFYSVEPPIAVDCSAVGKTVGTLAAYHLYPVVNSIPSPEIEIHRWKRESQVLEMLENNPEIRDVIFEWVFYGRAVCQIADPNEATLPVITPEPVCLIEPIHQFAQETQPQLTSLSAA